jgi:hypothetical protein
MSHGKIGVPLKRLISGPSALNRLASRLVVSRMALWVAKLALRAVLMCVWVV